MLKQAIRNSYLFYILERFVCFAEVAAVHLQQCDVTPCFKQYQAWDCRATMSTVIIGFPGQADATRWAQDFQCLICHLLPSFGPFKPKSTRTSHLTQFKD